MKEMKTIQEVIGEGYSSYNSHELRAAKSFYRKYKMYMYLGYILFKLFNKIQTKYANLILTRNCTLPSGVTMYSIFYKGEKMENLIHRNYDRFLKCSNENNDIL